MLNERPVIGVMGSHSKEWAEYAEPLGEAIAEAGYHLLTGAGAGVMGVVSRSFTAVEKRDGISLGVIPVGSHYAGEMLSFTDYPNAYIELPILVRLDAAAERDTNPFSRNNANILTSDAVVVLPGEHGTQNEASMALMYHRPIILFGAREHFAHFPQDIECAEDIDALKDFLKTVQVIKKRV